MRVIDSDPVRIGARKFIDAEAVPESSYAHLRAIVENRQWIVALDQWYRAGGRPENATHCGLNLNSQSWQELQVHLCRTGWFTSERRKISPTVEGQDFLTRVNELYRATLRDNREDREVVEVLAGLPGGAAVDIGCGPGYSVLMLARLGFSPLYAYDLSPVAIAIARALLENEGKRAHLYAREATSLSEIDGGSLALVFSRGAFHYFKQIQLARTLERTLRPGGYVVAELVALGYYLQRKHLKSLLTHRWRQPISYARTIVRTLINEVGIAQPRLAAVAPEIGYTIRSIRRLAQWAGLEIVSVSPAPTSIGYLVVMKKPD
jgi:SAM-dependent methyltransferase